MTMTIGDTEKVRDDHHNWRFQWFGVGMRICQNSLIKGYTWGLRKNVPTSVSVFKQRRMCSMFIFNQLFKATMYSCIPMWICKNISNLPCSYLSGLVSSVRRAHSSKLRGPGFKSQPGTVGGLITIIMFGQVEN